MDTTTAKMKNRKTKAAMVIIAWIGEHDVANSVSTIGYNGGNGPVRVYERDHYDDRMDLGNDPGSTLPYFTDASRAIVWMTLNRGKQIQLDVHAARTMGFEEHELTGL